MAPASIDRERFIQSLRRWEAGMVDGAVKLARQHADADVKT